MFLQLSINCQGRTMMKKPKNNKRTQNTTHPYLSEIVKSYKKGFRAVVIFSFFINLLMLAVPIYLLQVYDKIIPNHSSDTLYFLSVAVVVALITLATLELLRNTILAKLGVWFNLKLGNHLLGSSILGASKSQENASVNSLKDLSKLREFTTSSAVTSLLDLPWVPLYIAILFFIHPIIGTLVLIGALILFSIAIFNEITTRPLIARTEEANGNSIDVASSYVRNADTIEAMGMRKHIVKRWEDGQQEALNLQYQIDKKRAKTISLVKLIRLLLQIAVIGTAALLILKAELTPGATIATILLMRSAISPLERSISTWKSVLKARNAYGKINQHLTHAPTLNHKQEMPSPSGALTVENIRYRYPTAKKSLFQGIKFRVNPGEAIALVGPTAAGKSSLSRILAGITTPSSGVVRIGGHDISLWDSDALGKDIGYLPQTIELFSGSVRENIARMQEGDLDKVILAAKSAGIHDVIMSFPKGYGTEIGEDGAYLSGGQKQRLALARAIYDQPKYVVLDEPDAHLDIEGKVALARVIQKLKASNAVVIVITHHNSLHNFVDRIFDLEKKTFVPKQSDNIASSNKTTSKSQSSSSRSRSKSRSRSRHKNEKVVSISSRSRS